MSYCYACDCFVAVPIILEHRPYCTRCAEYAEDYLDANYDPVPHNAEVTARIDAVIRDHYGERDALEQQTAGAVIREYVSEDDPRAAPRTRTVAGDILGSGTLITDSPYTRLGDNSDDDPLPSASEPVPLAEQIAEFGTCAEYVMDALAANLADPWYRNAIVRLGVERLTAGYEDYGDAMYHWSENHRDDEMFEEIADAVVYGTSGKFFDVRQQR